jgi:glyoxylase-like metal-dependent hydrolase (beta-lactamase superfamily II)
MITVQRFVFNEFQTNTYVLHDETRECIIIDAACNTDAQWVELDNYITNNNLTIKDMLMTHCHTDHVLGCYYVTDKYGIGYRIHPKGKFFLGFVGDFAKAYQIHIGKILEPVGFFEDGEKITFGNSTLEVLYTPGHADGSVCFYNASQGFVISGDVLFKESIGRTDLPTGNYSTLKESIEKKLFALSESTLVYPGHGPATSIGHEKLNNPFL